MRKVLVTGAKGMLGQDLCPVLEDSGYEVIETDVDNFDITSPNMVSNLLMKEKPEILIHCAAYTNVDKAEDEPDTARKINSLGTKNLAQACAKLGITLVYISTDYVFNGEKTEKYLPDDEPNPINVYGQTKLEGENYIKEICKKYYILRTAWLYGIHGKNFVETMISMADKPELKVVNDQIGCPTWTMELAQGIVEIIEEEFPFGIYHVCGSGSCSWFEFAQEIFKLTGETVNLIPCTTDEFPRKAKRPPHSVMENQNLCRNWKLALKDYIKLRN